MFLLAALLAAAADGATARAARAAGHELRQRLGGGQEPEGAGVEPEPPLEPNAILDRFVREYRGVPQYGWQQWGRVEASLGSIVFRLYGHLVPRDAIGVSVVELDTPGIKMRVPRLPPRSSGSGFSHPYTEATEVLRAVLLRTGRPIDQWSCIDSSQIISILDWLHDDATARVGDRTWPELVAQAAAWHEDLVGVGFRAALPDAWVVARDREGWTLQRLTEKQDLADEGTSMGHCIGGPDRGGGRRDGESRYWQLARDDKAVLLSLRDPNGVPQITVEIDATGKLLQVQGPEDNPPSQEAVRQFKLFLHALGGDEYAWKAPNLGTPIAITEDRQGWPYRSLYRDLWERRPFRDSNDVWARMHTFASLASQAQWMSQVRPNKADQEAFSASAPGFRPRGYLIVQEWPVTVGLAEDKDGAPSWFTAARAPEVFRPDSRAMTLTGPITIHPSHIRPLALVLRLPDPAPDVRDIRLDPSLVRPFRPPVDPREALLDEASVRAMTPYDRLRMPIAQARVLRAERVRHPESADSLARRNQSS